MTGLQDERGRLIDGISSIIPVRAVKRDGDQVALYAAERRGAPRRAGLRAEVHAGAERGDGRHDARVAARRADAGPGRRRRPGRDRRGERLRPARRRLARRALRGARHARCPGSERDGPLRRRPDRAVPRPDARRPRSTPSGEGLFVDSGPGPLHRARGRLEINAAVDPASRAARSGGCATVSPPLSPGRGRRHRSFRAFPTRCPSRATRWASCRRTPGPAAPPWPRRSPPSLPGRGARSDDDRAYLTARQSTLAEQESPRHRRRYRRRARIADPRRADLRRERPGALGDRRPDEASAGGLTPCA